jgi:hypothetical protein
MPLPVSRIRSGALVPARALEPARLEEVLLPVLHQFNLMQQQMFDQFHQTMLMMVQMFSTLHREQMSLLREELDKLHAINRELQSLQSEFGWQPAASLDASPDAVNHAQSPAAEPVGGPAAKSKAGSANNVPPPAADTERRGDAIHPGQTDPAVHAWLSQRIAALQQERQGRWQKIVKFVMGK